MNEKGISRCLKVYYKSFQVVSFRAVCANLHQMHVAAADDGNCCCYMTVIDCNYLFKVLLLSNFAFHLFSPFHAFVKYYIQYLMFQSLIGELVEFSTSKPVICQPVNLVTCQPGDLSTWNL